MNDRNSKDSIDTVQIDGDTQQRSWFHRLWLLLRSRILSGLLLVLPFVLTAWIVIWMYTSLDTFLIRPMARLVVGLLEGRTTAGLPLWFTNFGAPCLGIVAVLGLLYFLGFMAKSRTYRILDNILLRVPIVTSIYKTVRQLFDVLRGSGDLTKFQRVVLVEFPHHGMRVPGFVTGSCRDKSTGKTILCVYIPTTPIPTSGYMLLVPEEDVVEPEWSLEQTIQTIVSGGISAPTQVRYYAKGEEA